MKGKKKSEKEESGNGEPMGEEVNQELETEEAKSTNETSSAELEKAQKELLYLRAEFDNYRKRMLREQEQSIRYANEKLIGQVLSVVDLFERALSHSDPFKGDEKFEGFLQGIDLTYRELVQLLERFGVEFIGKVGEKFDPVRHEAISQREGEEPNTVLEILQKGCSLQGRLIKPARVVVAKAK